MYVKCMLVNGYILGVDLSIMSSQTSMYPVHVTAGDTVNLPAGVTVSKTLRPHGSVDSGKKVR